MSALSAVLLDPANTDQLRTEVRELIDAEVADKSGPSGMVIRAGYAAVGKLRPSTVDDAIGAMWPKSVEALAPFYDAWDHHTDFGTYLSLHADEVSDALLAVTDQRVEGTQRPGIKQVYSSLRPSAKKNVVAALPRLGTLVQKWMS